MTKAHFEVIVINSTILCVFFDWGLAIYRSGIGEAGKIQSIPISITSSNTGSRILRGWILKVQTPSYFHSLKLSKKPSKGSQFIPWWKYRTQVLHFQFPLYPWLPPVLNHANEINTKMRWLARVCSHYKRLGKAWIAEFINLNESNSWMKSMYETNFKENIED